MLPQPIKDWVLLLMVAVMVAIDVVFLIIVTVDMWRLTRKIRLMDREVLFIAKPEIIPSFLGMCIYCRRLIQLALCILNDRLSQIPS